MHTVGQHMQYIYAVCNIITKAHLAFQHTPFCSGAMPLYTTRPTISITSMVAAGAACR